MHDLTPIPTKPIEKIQNEIEALRRKDMSAIYAFLLVEHYNKHFNSSNFDVNDENTWKWLCEQEIERLPIKEIDAMKMDIHNYSEKKKLLGAANLPDQLFKFANHVDQLFNEKKSKNQDMLDIKMQELLKPSNQASIESYLKRSNDNNFLKNVEVSGNWGKKR